MIVWGKRVLDRGNGKRKCFEVGIWFVCLRKSRD